MHSLVMSKLDSVKSVIAVKSVCVLTWFMQTV